LSGSVLTRSRLAGARPRSAARGSANTAIEGAQRICETGLKPAAAKTSMAALCSSANEIYRRSEYTAPVQ